MSSEEEIFREHDLNERVYLAANGEEAVRRTREALRKARMDDARKQVDFTNGTPVRTYSESQIRATFPDPQETQLFQYQAPEGVYTDDSKPNSYGAISSEPTEVRKAWFAMLARSQPTRAQRKSQTFEASSRIAIRERRY